MAAIPIEAYELYCIDVQNVIARILIRYLKTHSVLNVD